MSSESCVMIESLSKCYHVFNSPPDRLKQSILPRLQKVAAPIGRLVGKTITPRQYFQEFWALRDVSFSVGRGEAVGVIGRNGAGKSTLLQLVCGTLTPTSGSVVVKGRVAALLELGSGFNPEFTGVENIHLNASVLGLSSSEIDAKLSDIITFADIGDFIHQPVKTYSSGMAMRLAFAVIAHVDADVLIVDEALSVGDAYFQQKCMRWLRGFCERGTLLFCGHDISAVMSFCNKAIWLDAGAIKAVGDSKEVCEAYTSAVYAQSTGLPAAAIRSSRRKSFIAKEQSALQRPAQSITVFEFNDKCASFGSGDGTVLDVRLSRPDGSDLNWIEGGEEVCVTITVRAEVSITHPIVGFHVKDRLGQPLFGDNTYLAFREKKFEIKQGEIVDVKFVFDLPCLQSGEYAITAAIASGTLENHVQHHWLHDALVFTVNSPYRNGVMVAIPMRSITIDPVTQLSLGTTTRNSDSISTMAN
ncbi:ABC transporter ATP-binding protein [Bradyrhizobium sp. BRP22]|uniref:ABC transporter ATP-binding protein n=1 Tax=Bradyrhizobium sp. BRP22 TaxID=2793821 RepID=UPI001CD31349|nr:ABC transporter ATP-binding protein [Bradyrhizobium sp. BRP22]MCA1452090.1 ABC transporter ATP-binding protein [Bradyrhizobium sp. BRP22]